MGMSIYDVMDKVYKVNEELHDEIMLKVDNEIGLMNRFDQNIKVHGAYLGLKDTFGLYDLTYTELERIEEVLHEED